MDQIQASGSLPICVRLLAPPGAVHGKLPAWPVALGWARSGVVGRKMFSVLAGIVADIWGAKHKNYAIEEAPSGA